MNATSCARATAEERLRSGCDVIVTVAAVIVKSTNSRYQITYCTYYSHVKSKSSTHTHSRRHSITASQQQQHHSSTMSSSVLSTAASHTVKSAAISHRKSSKKTVRMDVIGAFTESTAVQTPNAIQKERVKKGLCRTCGERTHKISGIFKKKKPVTVVDKVRWIGLD